MKSMSPQTCEPSSGEQWVDCKVGGLDHWDWLMRSMVVYPGLEVEHNCPYKTIVALKLKHFPNHCYISVHQVCVQNDVTVRLTIFE